MNYIFFFSDRNLVRLSPRRAAIIFPFAFIVTFKIFHQRDWFLSVSNTATNWISYVKFILPLWRCIAFVSCCILRALSSDYKTDKVSSLKFDFLEFTFYRKLYLNFRIISEERTRRKLVRISFRRRFYVYTTVTR